MKSLLAALVLFFSLVLGASAVDYNLANVSLVVYTSNGTTITRSIFTNRTYINFVAARDTVSPRDLFIAVSGDTGNLVVVHRPTSTLRYNIISGLSANGSSTNGTSTLRYTFGGATLSTTSTDFGGSFFETVTRNRFGRIASINRQVQGGNGNTTIKGSCIATARIITIN